MVRTRIAPSPSGFLHIGTARTALFNYLYARRMGGEFILRIEDTDLERSDKKFEEDIKEGLQWLGLDWSGAIYHQSERLDIYKKYLQELLDSNKAFWCHHTKEELEQENKGQRAKNQAPRHICEHKDQRPTTNDQRQGIIRLSVDTDSDRKIILNDIIRGRVEFEEKLLGDISLAKDLDTPLYNFAVVIDDIDMKITHVIRGEDHISNTPKQLLIYEALGKEPPKFAHLPLILAPDRSKLSKRNGATSINDFKKNYLPEAMVNFMGFLGYTYDKDIISLEEMLKEFELEKVHKSGAIFDTKKLNWINSQYIKNISIENLRKLTNIKEIPEEALPLITERLEKLTDVKEYSYFWEEPDYDKSLLKWKRSTIEESLNALKKVNEVLEKIDFKEDILRSALDNLGQELGDRGLVYWPLRVALTGKEKSPDPVDVAMVLKRDTVLKRIHNALNFKI